MRNPAHGENFGLGFFSKGGVLEKTESHRPIWAEAFFKKVSVIFRKVFLSEPG